MLVMGVLPDGLWDKVNQYWFAIAFHRYRWCHTEGVYNLKRVPNHLYPLQLYPDPVKYEAASIVTQRQVTFSSYILSKFNYFVNKYVLNSVLLSRALCREHFM